MSLFIILTAITFLNAYKTRLVSVVIKLISGDPHVKTIASEINSLKNELKMISVQQEFVKYAKLTRKINKLQEEKKELVKKNAFKIMKIKYALTSALYFIIICCMIFLIWWYRSESVAQIPAHWLWPVSSYFDWSNYIPGSITVPCWVAISSSASKTFAKHF